MHRICTFCEENPIQAKGLCSGCLARRKANGSPERRNGGSLMEKLWRRVEVNDGGCWIWHGASANGGYAMIWFNGRMERGSRVVYREVGRKKIPPGYFLDHLCRNVACVNPDHLEPVTPAVNTQRGHIARGTARGIYALSPR